MPKFTCKTCDFWNAKGRAGECRVHAPRLVKFEGADPCTAFPETFPHESCGDWQRGGLPSAFQPDGPLRQFVEELGRLRDEQDRKITSAEEATKRAIEMLDRIAPVNKGVN